MSNSYRGEARTDIVLVEEYLNKGDHGAAADYLQGRLQSVHKRGQREENEACAKLQCYGCRHDMKRIKLPEEPYRHIDPDRDCFIYCNANQIHARTEKK